MTCHITSSASLPDGTPFASSTIVFERRDKAVASSGGAVLVPERVTIQTNSSGAFSVDLAPGSYLGAVRTATGTVSFAFAVPDTATADLADLIDAAAIVAQPDAVVQAQAARDEAVAARDAVLASVGAFFVLPPSPTTLLNAAALSGRKSVTLREIIGTAYSEAQDVSAILNTVLPSLSAAGIRITNSEALILSMKSRLFLVDDFDVDFGPAILWLDFAYHHRITHTNYDGGGKVKRVKWRGGKIIARDLTMRGHVFLFDAQDSVFDGITIRDYSGGMAVVFSGTDLILRDWDTRSSLTEPGGDDAYHLESGTRILCQGLKGEANDDIFICGPSPHFTVGHPRYGLSLTEVQYADCLGKSNFARLCVVSLGGFSDLGLLLNNEIKRISFSNIKGQASEGCNVVGMATQNPNQIDDINFSNVQWTAIDGDGGTTGGWAARIFQTYTRPGCVGRVTFDQCSFNGPANSIGILADAPGAVLSLENCTVTAKDRALAVNYAADVRIDGGRYGIISTTGTPVDIYAAGAKLEVSGNPIFDGVTTNRAAIRCTNGSIVVNSATANKLAGATNTNAVLVNSPGSAEIFEARIGGTVDAVRASASTGAISINRRAYPVRTGAAVTTIASDVAAVAYGDLNVLDTEGAAATDNLAGLSAPVWLELGQVIPLCINSAARVVTVLHDQSGLAGGYYPIRTATGSSVVLASTATVMRVMWMGDHFRDMTYVLGGDPSVIGVATKNQVTSITGGAITFTTSVVDLNILAGGTITALNGPSTGFPLYIVRNFSTAVTLQHSASGIRLAGGADYVLGTNQALMFIRLNSTVWQEIGRP